MRVALSKPICTTQRTIGPHGANHQQQPCACYHLGDHTPFPCPILGYHAKILSLCSTIGLKCNRKCTTYISLNKPISNLTKPACTCSCIPIGENPSCLHTTLASEVLQESSHAVPHVLLLQISTRPSYLCVPP